MHSPNEPQPTVSPLSDPFADVDPARRRVLMIELLVVLCFGFVPNLVFAISYVGGDDDVSFASDMIAHVVFGLQVVVPLLYIMWRSGDSWSQFGIVKPEWIVDIVLAVVIFGVSWVVSGLLTNLVAPPYDPTVGEELADGGVAIPHGAWQWAVLVVGLTCNSLVEEFVMRAYLITRLRQLGAHVTMAVVISAIMFASYHIYQGGWVILPNTALGVIFGTAFVLTRRVWPLVIAHTVYNLFVYASY